MTAPSNHSNDVPVLDRYLEINGKGQGLYFYRTKRKFQRRDPGRKRTSEAPVENHLSSNRELNSFREVVKAFANPQERRNADTRLLDLPEAS